MTLDDYQSIFAGLDNSQKYTFIKKFKKLLDKQPELRDDIGHPLYIAIHEWHIENICNEITSLRKFYNYRADQLLDTLSDAPIGYLGKKYQDETDWDGDTSVVYMNGYNRLQEDIGFRIAALEDDLKEYQSELKKRTNF